MNTKPQYGVRPYTYQWSTTPAYYYVWDRKNLAMIGGRYPTAEAAQAAADSLNAEAAPAES